MLLEYGEGCEKDEALAVRCYNMAAKQGKKRESSRMKLELLRMSWAFFFGFVGLTS